LTAAPRDDYAWLATLLDLLLERYSDDAARALLRDPEARAEVFRVLAPDLVAAGASQSQLDSAEVDNLLMAIAALRVKFAPEEARAKVRLNIAMRAAR
jgi:hypothetical protein